MDDKDAQDQLAVGRLHRNQAERDAKSWGCECAGCTDLRQLSSVAAALGRMGGLASRGAAKRRAGRKGGKIGGKTRGPSKARSPEQWRVALAKGSKAAAEAAAKRRAKA